MIGDLKRNVLTVYKADTSGMKKAIGDLRDETKKLGEEQKKGTDGFEKFAAAGMKVAGVVAGAKIVWDSYKMSVEESRLKMAAAGVDIERLSKASGGLKSSMQLLQEAAKMNNAAFKLSSEQMTTAEKAMRQLTRAGFDQEEVSKKVLDAIVKLEGDGLKDFGIRVRQTQGDTEKFSAIMEALAKEANKVNSATLTESESLAKMGKQFEETFDRIKRSIGQMVVALQPLIEGVALLAEKAGGLVEFSAGGLGDLTNLMGAAFGSSSAERRLGNKYGVDLVDGQMYAKTGDMIANWEAGGQTISDLRDSYMGSNLRHTDTAREMDRFANSTATSRDSASVDYRDSVYIRTLTETYKEVRAEWIEKNRPKWEEQALKAAEASATREAMSTLRSATFEPRSADAFTGTLGAAADSAVYNEYGVEQDLRSMIAATTASEKLEASVEAATRKSKRQNKLEEMFGPVDQIDGFALAFQGLSGAVNAAMTAWIDGSMSASEAMEKFTGSFLKGLSTMLMTESLKHAAYAIASAIPGPTFNPAGIGGHAAAAAAFAGAALLAGAGAKAMGGGGASAGAGASGGAAPTYQPGSSSGQSRERHGTVVIANGFVEGGPRQRQRYANKLLETAMGPAGVAYSS